MSEWREVSAETFGAWIALNSDHLRISVANFCEPMQRCYYDKRLTGDPMWKNMVGRVVLFELYAKDGPDPYRWRPNRYDISTQALPSPPQSGGGR